MAGPRRLSRLCRDLEPLIPPGPVVVALSGGPDSAVAAHVVLELGRSSRAVHVHHGLPGSDRMEAAAKEVAVALGLPLDIRRVQVPTGPSPEAQARAVRRDALETASGGDWIITGHHGDDLAETVIDRLARGSGSTGLAGIRQIDGQWVRPLLGVSGSEVRSIADELGLPYGDDPANSDLSHRRNRIRHEVVPVLTDALGTDVVAGIGRSARLLAGDDEALESAADSIAARRRNDEFYLASAELVTAQPPVAARAVRRVLRSAHGGLPGDAREVTAVMGVADGSTERADLSGRWSVIRDGPWVVVTATPLLPSPAPVALDLPGDADFGPYRLMARRGGVRPIGRSGVVLDAGLWRSGVEVRSAQPGERIDIGPSPGQRSKKVSDALAECRIPLRRRAGWPVLSARGNIAWIAGCRAAPWAAPQDDGEEEPVVVSFRRPPWIR